jgi:hypothetical protein
VIFWLSLELECTKVPYPITSFHAFLVVPIVIGFEVTQYVVDESVGSLEVFVSVSMPDGGQMLVGGVSLVIQSVAGSAGKDYLTISWVLLSRIGYNSLF